MTRLSLMFWSAFAAGTLLSAALFMPTVWRLKDEAALAWKSANVQADICGVNGTSNKGE